jgi:twitching motility protein PilT
MIRVDGELEAIPDAAALTPADTEIAVTEIIQDSSRLEELRRDGELDFGFSVPGLARFRVNVFRQRGSMSIVCRRIPYGITTIQELGLPEVVRQIAEETRGMVIVTGTTGSGKSTTLAAMVDHINRQAPRHIVTIEDPIEFLHADNRSIINQREIGADTGSFGSALRRVLRQDPDVILIGEMRDEETVATALSAAETGHLVFSTLHTADAAEAINRMIDFFPPHQQGQIRSMLASTLRGVISQRLVPRVGGGRVAALEVLRATGRVRDAILSAGGIGELSEIIAEGSYYGMQTFDQALFEFVRSERVTREEAIAFCSSPQDFKLLLAAEGQTRATLPQEATPEPQAPASVTF